MYGENCCMQVECLGVIKLLLKHKADIKKCRDFPGTIQQRLFHIKDHLVLKACLQAEGMAFSMPFWHELLRVSVVHGRQEHVAMLLQEMQKFGGKEFCLDDNGFQLTPKKSRAAVRSCKYL